MRLRQAIPYDTVKDIILNCENPKARALIAFQYACGCRIGELLTYEHKKVRPFWKKKFKRLRDEFERERGYRPSTEEIIDALPPQEQINIYNITHSEGIKKSNLRTEKKDKEDYYLKIILDNFKAPSIRYKVLYISRKTEKWLYRVLVRYTKSLPKGQDALFTFKQGWARKLIDFELKKYDPNWSTHYLRHSRLTHLDTEFSLGVPIIQRMAGHTNLSSTSVYLHPDEDSIIEKMERRS